MNRNIAIAIVLAASASSSFADDITIDASPFVPTATSAEVRAELNRFKQSRVNPWSTQYNPLTRFSSQRTRAEVVTEYVNAREQVAAFSGEDSGSVYLSSHVNDAVSNTFVAGQSRNPQ